MRKGETILATTGNKRWKELYDIFMRSGYEKCIVECRDRMEAKSGWTRAWYYKRDNNHNLNCSIDNDTLILKTSLKPKRLPGAYLDAVIMNKNIVHIMHKMGD